MKDYYVYILANNAQVLYIGVTNNLESRFFEHTVERDTKSFVARYNLDRLVFYETYPTPNEAIAREKKKKLIRDLNPTWRNLFEDLTYGMMDIPEIATKKGRLN